MRTVTGHAIEIALPAGWAWEWEQGRVVRFYDPVRGWIGHAVRIRRTFNPEPPRPRADLRLRALGTIELATSEAPVHEVTTPGDERAWCALISDPFGRAAEVVVMPADETVEVTASDALDILRDVALELRFV